MADQPILAENIGDGDTLEAAQARRASKPAALAKIASDKAKEALKDIDIASVRSLREYIAAQPDAPQILLDHEAAAVGERAKVI